MILNYKVEKESQTVNNILKQNLGISSRLFSKLINNHLVSVNNIPCDTRNTVHIGDIISIDLNYPEDSSNIAPVKMDLDIVYEDDNLMVINKPSGMVVHPAAGHFSGTLVNALLAHTKDLSSKNGDERPGIVHRIDKDTSGLLVVAKNDKTHEALANQLKDKTLSRIYVALVKGRINHDTGTIDAPIGRDPYDRKKMCVTDQNSRNAVTHFKVLERYKNSSLIECKLETGRTHQIRVHMNYIGHPIINDPVYGGKKNIDNFGQMLHAKEIGFINPATGRHMTFSCDVPDEFNKILEIYKNE